MAIKKGLTLEEAFKALNGRMAVKESLPETRFPDFEDLKKGIVFTAYFGNHENMDVSYDSKTFTLIERYFQPNATFRIKNVKSQADFENAIRKDIDGRITWMVKSSIKESLDTDLSKLKVKDLKNKTIDLTELGFGYVNYLGIYNGYVVCTYDDAPWARKLDAKTLEQSVLEIASWSQGELTEEDIQDIKIINQPISDIVKVKKLIDIIKNQTDLREGVEDIPEEDYKEELTELEALSMFKKGEVLLINNNDGYTAIVPRNKLNDENAYTSIDYDLGQKLIAKYDLKLLDRKGPNYNQEIYVYDDVKIKKFLIDDYIELIGAEPGDYDFNNLKAKFIYTDEKEESAQVGIEFENGKFAVVGLNNDHMCDDYKHMVQCIKSYL